jgi:hypothetical protein
MLELDEPDPVLDKGASFGDVAFLISSAQTMVAWMPALSRQGVNLCGADLAAARPRHCRRARYKQPATLTTVRPAPQRRALSSTSARSQPGAGLGVYSLRPGRRSALSDRGPKVTDEFTLGSILRARIA